MFEVTVAKLGERRGVLFVEMVCARDASHQMLVTAGRTQPPHCSRECTRRPGYCPLGDLYKKPGSQEQPGKPHPPQVSAHRNLFNKEQCVVITSKCEFFDTHKLYLILNKQLSQVLRRNGWYQNIGSMRRTVEGC